MAKREAPAVIRQQRDGVVGLVEQPLVGVVTQLGTQQQPRARLKLEIGVHVVKPRLVHRRFQPPIGEQFPVQHIVHLA